MCSFGGPTRSARRWNDRAGQEQRTFKANGGRLRFNGRSTCNGITKKERCTHYLKNGPPSWCRLEAANIQPFLRSSFRVKYIQSDV